MKHSLSIAIWLTLVTISLPALADQRLEVNASIHADIADLSCETDADCSTFGYGEKPCGGPWSYKLYSRKTVNEQDLLAKVDKYNRMDKYYNKDKEMLSDCVSVIPPATACVHGMCNAMPVGIGFPSSE